MKSFAKVLFFLHLAARAVEPIQSVPLDDQVMVEVPVATNRVTTLRFPGPITAMDACNVSTDPKVPADFQLAHTKGSSFVSVRAVVPRARTNLNIHWNRRTYVFQLAESGEPVLFLNLRTKDSPVALPAPRLSPTRLLALLDKAKAFPLLKTQHPTAVADVQFRSLAGQTNVTDYGDFTVQLEEVYRFEVEDSLVFRVLLRSGLDTPLQYRPESLSVRAGARVYPQSISDASGTLPPRAEATVYFAITGTPDGGRNDLAIKNQFTVQLERP